MTCFVDSHGRSSPFCMEEKQMGEVDGRGDREQEKRRKVKLVGV